ncbi:MAG TPA: ClpXP protease specificity-enhancing factor SspB [Kofleriaceae bacterium]|nr:ClpXP protease specificity-enhancing factor SspB [Kofleriaceae bacterium]
MADLDDPRLARIQAVVTALIENRLAASLTDVEGAIARWRGGEQGVLDVHDAVVRHAQESEALIKRVMAAAAQPDGVIKDAFEAGVITADEVQALTGKAADAITAAGSLEPPATPPPAKRAVIDELLGRGPVLIHLDARRADVAVPERFRGEAKLVLRFGYGLTPPIPDLTVDEQGVSATLTFGGAPFHCVLPWASIYAAVADGEQRGMVWPDDIPEDLLMGTTGQPSAPAPAAPGATTGASPAAPAEGGRSKRPTHLKLVE